MGAVSSQDGGCVKCLMSVAAAADAINEST
jgi:hypothetical protein